jgi:hypothetical protein
MKIFHIAIGIPVAIASLLLPMGSSAQSGSRQRPFPISGIPSRHVDGKHNTNGSAGATATGTYTFALDLKGHALQRTSSVDRCSGPNLFDCQHHDQLTIYANPSGTLKALYIDSEGHVIDYTIATPDPTTAIFTSEGPAAAPHYKLIYHLDSKVMTGKFQGAAPGSTDFYSYLEWSGTKQ